MIQIHKASAVQQNGAEVVLKTERGEEPSESRSGYGWVERQGTTQKKKSPFLLKSIYKSLQIWHLKTKTTTTTTKNRRGWEFVVTEPTWRSVRLWRFPEALLYSEDDFQPALASSWDFRRFWQHCGGGGGLTVVHFHLIQTPNIVNKHGLKRGAARPFPPTARSLSNKTFPPALPNVGVSVSWQARRVPF